MMWPTISEGLVIFREGRTYEYVRQTSSDIWFEDIEDGSFIHLTEVQLREEHASQRLLVIDAISTKARLTFDDAAPERHLSQELIPANVLKPHQQIKLDRRLSYVLGLLRRDISKGQRRYIAEAAKQIAKELEEPIEAVPSFQTLNRWMKQYESSRRDAIALIDMRAMRKQTLRLPAQQELLIQQAIDVEIFERGQRNAAVFRRYEDLVHAENARRLLAHEEPLPPCAPNTVMRRIAQLSQYEVAVARKGRQQADRDYRMMRGHIRADYPLQYAEIDHTQLDLYVLDDMLFLPLGLPWVTIIRDRRTGVVLGFFISFQKTSLQSIFGAIRHSLYAHTKIQTIWPDIENPWLSSGPATTYVSDRGLDFMSTRYRLTIRQLGADYQYCARRTPWHKPYIERFCGELNVYVETMPGHTFPFRMAPKEYDARKHAVVRFSSLIYLIHKWICDSYHVKPHSRKLASPMERYREEISHIPAPIPPSLESLHIVMGEPRKGALRHDGIQHQLLHYANDELRELRERIGLGKLVEFVSHPSDMGYIHVLDPQTHRYFRVDALDQDYAAGTTLFQHQYAKRLKQGKLNHSNASAVLSEARRAAQEQLAEEIQAKENAYKTKVWQQARALGINSNAVLDGEVQSLTKVLRERPISGKDVRDGKEPASATAPEAVPNPFTDVPLFSWGQ